MEREEELKLTRSVPSVFLGGETGDAVRALASKEEEEEDEGELESKEDRDFSVLNKARVVSALTWGGLEEGGRRVAGERGVSGGVGGGVQVPGAGPGGGRRLVGQARRLHLRSQRCQGVSLPSEVCM